MQDLLNIGDCTACVCVIFIACFRLNSRTQGRLAFLWFLMVLQGVTQIVADEERHSENLSSLPPH